MINSGCICVLLATLCTLLAGCTAASETVAPEPSPVPSDAYSQARAQHLARAQMPEDVFSPAQYRDRMTEFYVARGIPVAHSYISVSMYRQDNTRWGGDDTIAVLARTVEGQPADYVYHEGDTTFVMANVYPQISWVKAAEGGLLLFLPDVLTAASYAQWQHNAEAFLRYSPYAAWKEGLPKSEWNRGWRELMGMPPDR